MTLVKFFTVDPTKVIVALNLRRRLVRVCQIVD